MKMNAGFLVIWLKKKHGQLFSIKTAFNLFRGAFNKWVGISPSKAWGF
jgi:hypothetical protein